MAAAYSGKRLCVYRIRFRACPLLPSDRGDLARLEAELCTIEFLYAHANRRGCEVRGPNDADNVLLLGYEHAKLCEVRVF